MLHRGLQVVDRRGEVDGVAVDVGRKTRPLLALEILAGGVVREGEPAGRRDVGAFVDRVDLVLRGEALGDDFKLQLSDRTEKDVPELPGEDLNGALFAEFLQALLKLLGLEGVLAAGRAEEFRREVRNARKEHALAFGERVTDVQLSVVVDPDDVARDGVGHDDAVLRHEGERIGELHFAAFAHVVHLHALAVAGPCWPGS